MFHKQKKIWLIPGSVLVLHITDYELCLSKLASKKCLTDWKISWAKEEQMPRKLGSDALQRYRYNSFFGNQIYAILG